MSPPNSSGRDRSGREPIPLRDAVAAFGRDLGLPEPDALTTLIAAWPELVGAAIAAHAEVRSVRDGVCTIAVDDPAWATELRYREDDLAERAEAVCGRPVFGTIRVVISGPRKTGS